MQNYKMVIGLLGCVFGLAVAASACEVTGPNPDYCWNADGDATCEAKYPGQGLFCSNETNDCPGEGKYGCVAEQPADECYSPCGGEQSVLTNSDCVGVAGDAGSETGFESGSDSGSGSDSDSETGSETTEIPCECESDDICLAADAALPLCNGCECVQCNAEDGDVCASQWLACNADKFACVPCEDCGEQVCNHVTGQCLDGGLHVDGDDDRDFVSLQDAVASLKGASGTIILHEVTEMDDYSILEGEFIAIDAGQTLSIVAAPGEHPQVEFTEDDEDDDNPYMFEVSNGSLYLSGFEIVGERGIQVDGNGLVQIISMSVKTKGITMKVDGGQAFIANSILRIKDSGEKRPAVEVLGTAQLDATFTSIVGVKDENTALFCEENTTKVNIRNSLMGTLTDTVAIDCPTLSPTTTNYVEDMETPMEADWFTTGDLHLNTDHTPPELATTAIWSADDPSSDIDGDLRPDDKPTFAGADLPTP